MAVLTVLFIALIAFVSIAQAEKSIAEYIDVQPVREGENITLPALPEGAKLLNVKIYDDVNGIPGRNIGAVHIFKLKITEGFNYTYESATGRHWQMITPSTPEANGLKPDCSHPDGCKYVRSDYPGKTTK